MLQHSEPADAQLVGKRADCVGKSANCAAQSTLLSPYPGRSTPIIRTPAAVSSPGGSKQGMRISRLILSGAAIGR
jgi:hypothetical protein